MQEEKNSRGNVKDISLNVKDTSISIGYKKTNKLVTALYMVTDIMDKDEPLRTKLRNLGVEILSDIHHAKSFTIKDTGLKVINNTNTVISFLDLALTLGMISEMNRNILKKELMELHQSVKESIKIPNSFLTGHQSLSDFLSQPDENLIEEKKEPYVNPVRLTMFPPIRDNSIGHKNLSPNLQTRIGVQKGSTLLKALSDRMTSNTNHKEEFDLLKKDRRNEIILIIKTKNLEQVSKGQPLEVTITDIKNEAKGVLSKTSEKTLQRELVSMVVDGVLYKTGSKRWSRYFIK